MVIIANRGLLRIVEVSIAVMVIISIMLFIMSNRNLSAETDFSKVLQPLLEEIAKNITLREIIVTNSLESETQIEFFLSSKIKNPALGYEVIVCEPNEICGLKQYPTGVKEIFTDERIISSTLQSHGLKKIKIFLWVKPRS